MTVFLTISCLSFVSHLIHHSLGFFPAPSCRFHIYKILKISPMLCFSSMFLSASAVAVVLPSHRITYLLPIRIPLYSLLVFLPLLCSFFLFFFCRFAKILSTNIKVDCPTFFFTIAYITTFLLFFFFYIFSVFFFFI